MSAFLRQARHPSLSAEDAVRRYVEAVRRDIEPDPLFHRRLRSDVMNAWVATREGIGQPPRRRRLGNPLGALGRACLLASIGLCASLATVMAASSQALPGEPLYEVKLRVEELRVELLPSHFQEELAVTVLVERIGEMERLAASGANAEAAALLPAIQRQYAALERLLAARGSEASDLVASRLTVVARLVDALPSGLRARVSELMPRLPLAIPGVEADGAPSSPNERPSPANPDRGAGPPMAPDTEPNGEAQGRPPDRPQESDRDDDSSSDDGRNDAGGNDGRSKGNDDKGEGGRDDEKKDEVDEVDEVGEDDGG
jgi:Domain of unknown function (DUF5667)